MHVHVHGNGSNAEPVPIKKRTESCVLVVVLMIASFGIIGGPSWDRLWIMTGRRVDKLGFALGIFVDHLGSFRDHLGIV